MIPIHSARPQKSGESANIGPKNIAIPAPIVPVTAAVIVLPNAALSAPSMKNRPHVTNSAGSTRCRFCGSPYLPNTPSWTVTQWKVKFSATSDATNASTPIDTVSGRTAFKRVAMLSSSCWPALDARQACRVSDGSDRAPETVENSKILGLGRLSARRSWSPGGRLRQPRLVRRDWRS